MSRVHAGQGKKRRLSDEQVDAILASSDSIEAWADRLLVSRQTIVNARQVAKDRQDALARRQRARSVRSDRLREQQKASRARLQREIDALNRPLGSAQ